MKLAEVRYCLREQYTQTPLHLPSDRVHQIESDINLFRDLLATLYGVGDDDDAVQEVYMEVHSTDGEICPPLKTWVLLRGILVSFVRNSENVVSHCAIRVASITGLECETNREGLAGHVEIKGFDGSSGKILQPYTCRLKDDFGVRLDPIPCVKHFVGLYQALLRCIGGQPSLTAI